MVDKINLSFDEMWEKIIACDKSYDGLFFTAVITTKIYCRPSFKSRKPKKTNVKFYHDINEVEKAGFRPCKRCQPDVDQSPHIGLVKDVIAFLINNYKQKITLQDVANHVGVSFYYLERLFKQEISETPRRYLEKYEWIRLHIFLKTRIKRILKSAMKLDSRAHQTFIRYFVV